ncbi:hypothetical protein [Jeotgalibacillus sp. R-1-5s-1]|uniref:TcaA NTF2-like domain-containing protein n=1 Tax=Jeotgalibacillus sp. R-1-5s-1 TaxID=2555897 RepID=UPI00106AB535|nr:hypothetical protein [Jeotgalibacillus sp. R-1-5s-1]TFD97078.1 hypothetical protein E2491_10330 [Jeotgalibacillus sp. R-1-5s-1]
MFCLNCGASYEKGETFCRSCGQSFREESGGRKERKGLNIGLIGLIAGVVLLVGGYLGVSSYYSAENVADRFLTGLHEKDWESVQSNSVREDGSDISETEAKAAVRLIEQDEELRMELKSRPDERYVFNDLFMPVKHERKFFIFPQYKIMGKNQFVQVVDQPKGAEVSVGEIKGVFREQEDASFSVGPLFPGIYEITSAYEKGTVKLSGTIEQVLKGSIREPVVVSVDLGGEYASFSLVNSSAVKADLIFNGEKYDIDDYGYSEEIGPLTLDGKSVVQIEYLYPWGTQMSEEINVTDTYMEISPPEPTEELKKSLIDQTALYAEEYLNHYVSGGETAVTTVTNEWLDEMDYYADHDFEGSIELKELGFDFSGAQPIKEGDQYGYSIPLLFTMSAESIDFEFGGSSCDLHLLFNEADQSWKVNECYFYATDAYTYEDVMKPAVTTFTSTGSTVSSEEVTGALVTQEQVAGFMENYSRKSVEAINAVDYSLVAGLIADGSELKDIQTDYIDYLDSKNITETFKGAVVESFEQNGNTITATTLESFIIHREDGDDEMTFRTVTELVLENGELKAWKLIETNEL